MKPERRDLRAGNPCRVTATVDCPSHHSSPGASAPAVRSETRQRIFTARKLAQQNRSQWSRPHYVWIKLGD